MDDAQAAYDELYLYAMGRGRDAFILQHVVDATAAQTACEQTKPVKIVFALIGLYLHVEEGYSGRQVQEVHMRLGRRNQTWPPIALPRHRGSIAPPDVLTSDEGAARDAAIDAWCKSVWAAYGDENRTAIVEFLQRTRIL